MALKIVEREDEKSPIIVAHNGHCQLFRLSIFKLIKEVLRWKR